MYRTAFLSCVSILALSTGAEAQNIGRPLAAPTAGWAGAYAGVLAGAGFASNRWTDLGMSGGGGLWYPPAGPQYNSSPTGAALGLFAGYNWQALPFVVLGIEADITYNTARGTANVDSFGPVYVRSHSNFAGSLRARVGFAVDRALIYVTSGVALGNPSQRWFQPSGAAWKSDGAQVGFVIGAGVEYMVTPQWVIRAEAMHYDFGSRNAPNVTPASSPDFGISSGYFMRARSSQTQARVGAAYRF
jgi:outer membrane immunogenic protein